MATTDLRRSRVALHDGPSIPPLGLGTWRYGDSARSRADEVALIRKAIDIGYRLFDTAEMYGEGGSESVIGQAVDEALRAGDVARQELLIVSKVYPHNASRDGAIAACERSLKRLRLDRIDLYLLHWRGRYRLAHTVEAFETLVAKGRIGRWGVSNFDIDDLAELWHVPDGSACAINQVYYSLSRRGIEFDLVAWQRAHSLPVMAYCPIDQGVLANAAALQPIAARLGATLAQVALAWLRQRGGVIAIPKAAREAHLRENYASLDVVLDPAALHQLDALFPPPQSKQRLAMT